MDFSHIMRAQTTIRVLGGLLSAYALTNDSMYVEKAVDLADRIMPAFDTPARLPTSMINLAKREGVRAEDNKGLVSTAEISTLQLEFRYLSYLTDNADYWDAVEKVSLLGSVLGRGPQSRSPVLLFRLSARSGARVSQPGSRRSS